MSFGPTRRACLTLALGALAASRGEGLAAAPAAPSRIACIEWTGAETLLALGLAPVAAGDVPGYPDWVVAPAMPAEVIDLGSRFEPNRELLHRLKPDLVIAMQGYGLDARSFSGIAAVHEMTPFAEGVTALAHARRETERLAGRLGLEVAAQTLVRATDERLARAAQALAPFKDRPVVVVSIFEERSVRIYGGGLFGDVMSRLGLRNAWSEDIGPWGFAYVGIEQLARIEPGARVVILDPMPEAIRIRLEASSLWRNLPVVRSGSVVRIPPIWPFGGLPAAERFAANLSAALAST